MAEGPAAGCASCRLAVFFFEGRLGRCSWSWPAGVLVPDAYLESRIIREGEGVNCAAHTGRVDQVELFANGEG